MRSRFAFWRTAGLAFCMTLAVGARLAAAPQAAPAPRVKTAAQAFKNVQVLKDVPANQLIPMMRFIADSLGVQCTFCHVEDRSKDVKDTKQTARKMIKMVLEINQGSFNGHNAVSCYTCHHGSNVPVSVPDVVPPVLTAREPKATAPPKPTVDQILAKYVDALGGEQAIRAVKSRMITGTWEYAAGDKMAQVPMERYEKAPNLLATVVHESEGTTANGFNGSVAWSQDNKGRVREVRGRGLERAQRYSDFYGSLELKQMYGRMLVAGIKKVGDQEAYLVVGFPKGDTPERLYFDTQTGLLLRKLTVTPTPIGNTPRQVDYSDYREVNGVKMPFQIQISGLTPHDGETIHIEKVQDNVPIEDGRFAMPAGHGGAQ